MGTYSHKEQDVFEQAAASASHAMDYQQTVLYELSHRRARFDFVLSQLMVQAKPLTNVAVQLVETLHRGHKVLIAGNGGSAAQAQHFAAELVGRFKRERMPYPVLALTTDTATLTALANDYGYASVFARQIRAFGQSGDLFIAFSTSGESENLVQAAEVAHEGLLEVVALTGSRSSRLGRLADLAIRVPGDDTAETQEMHLVITHILCDIAEQRLAASESGKDDAWNFSAALQERGWS